MEKPDALNHQLFFEQGYCVIAPHSRRLVKIYGNYAILTLTLVFCIDLCRIF